MKTGDERFRYNYKYIINKKLTYVYKPNLHSFWFLFLFLFLLVNCLKLISMFECIYRNTCLNINLEKNITKRKEKCVWF